MVRPLVLTHLLLVLLGLLASCSLDEPSPPPSELLDPDTLARRSPAHVEHGPLELGSSLLAPLDPQRRLHAFSFTLAHPAHVALRVSPTGPEPYPRLALSLARIVRSRSHTLTHGRIDELTRTLDAGSYVLWVRVEGASEQRGFVLESECDGDGCPLPASPCLFGSQFSDLRRNPQLQIVSERWLRDVSELADEQEQEQVVLAVRESSHVDVQTASEALERVDQQEIRRLELRVRADARAYVAFEYGAGDNSYGAIFEANTSTRVASIHDGDLLHCTIPEQGFDQ